MDDQSKLLNMFSISRDENFQVLSFQIESVLISGKASKMFKTRSGGLSPSLTARLYLSFRVREIQGPYLVQISNNRSSLSASSSLSLTPGWISRSRSGVTSTGFRSIFFLMTKSLSDLMVLDWVTLFFLLRRDPCSTMLGCFPLPWNLHVILSARLWKIK